MMKTLIRILLVLLALALIVVGVIWTISPIPFGFVLIIVGLLVLASQAPRFVRWLRRRWKWFDRVLNALQRWLPRFLTRPLRESSPDKDKKGGRRAA
jgi:uncharacterized membrane protein YbaN (DUF454 family)